METLMSKYADKISDNEHYNPDENPHGCLSKSSRSGTRHLGDLGNIDVDSMGSARGLKKVWMDKPIDLIGRSMSISSNPDDCTTQPDGKSGDSIGFCTIGYYSGDVEMNNEDFDIK
ncbi:hypothetical protein MHBO_003625 [Bonamia ostreae]|uniref:Superoxide dismutase copper/zinc binding domain-containing protein n=1 Tax=Bonamia ostreae TaxID=126728 RepID=A0ABV2AR13_9EUKA